MNALTTPIWQPSPERIAGTRLTAFGVAADRHWNSRLAGSQPIGALT